MQNKLPAILPKYDSIRVSRDVGSYSSNHDQWHSVTPYNNDERVTTIMAERGIKNPFSKIITWDQGTSVCPHCKTTYAGYEYRCSNKIHYDTSSWHSKRLEYGLERDPVKFPIKDCAEYTKWDLEAEFDLQKEFFGFVELIGTINLDQPSLLQKFEHTLPKGTVDQYRIRYMENRVIELDMKMEQVRNALNQIAQKMNSAGHALSFGF